MHEKLKYVICVGVHVCGCVYQKYILEIKFL